MSSPLLFPPVCYRRYEIDHLADCADLRVPADPKLTTRVDCALTSVCRLVAMVNRRSAQPAQLIKLQSAATE